MEIAFRAERDFSTGLNECAEKQVTVCSICNGTFALGVAGLLTDTECTTHWRRVKESGQNRQQSIYLDYRNHINPQVHEVKDYLIDELSGENSIESLSSLVGMSPRNLSRVFKEKTGSTVLGYLTLLRKEYANTMLNNPE